MLNYDAAPPPAYPDQNVAKNLPPDRAVPAQTVPPSAQPGVPPTVPLVPGQPVPTYVGQHNNQRTEYSKVIRSFIYDYKF